MLSGDGGAAVCGRVSLIHGKITDGCAVLTPKQQSYWEISQRKCLDDGKLVHRAAFASKIGKSWWEDRAGLVAVGAAAVMGPEGDGSSTASPLSLSTGVPTPRRVPGSPRGPGVSVTCTSGCGWWAAAFPRGWPTCRMCFWTHHLPVFLPAAAKRHQVSSTPPPPGSKPAPACDVLGEVPCALFTP